MGTKWKKLFLSSDSVVAATKSRDRANYFWTIKNFSLLLEEKGKSIRSSYFYSEGKKEKWRIRFYPRGDEDSINDDISLYLHLSSGTLPVKVQCEMCIVHSGMVMRAEMFIHEFNSLEGFGFEEFVERSRLLGHPTDTLTVSCKIVKPLRNILTSPSNSSLAMTRELCVDTETGRLIENFTEILENSKFSDVTIIVKDKKFSAHKLVLATRSSVFAAMFENKEIDENEKNIVEIEKMEPSIVKGMLEFIYTDNVSNLDEISNGLLLAADKYDLVRLRALCEESLVKILSNETAIEILMLADFHHSDNLKKHVMHFMENHLANIINSEDYKKLEKYPRLLMEFFRFMAQRKSQKS